MKALILDDYLQQDLNRNLTKNFHSNFSVHKVMMKNQIENENISKDSLKNFGSSYRFPKNVHQIILGSLLGDMHCRRECLNSNIQETHSISQQDYLKWKYLILKGHLDLRLYLYNNPICKAKSKIYFRKPEIRLRSKVSDKLNFYWNLFYKNGKKTVTIRVLNQLDALGLAVWYCDDGHYDPQNRTVEIHTEGFSIEENKLIKTLFFERWNLIVNFKKAPSKRSFLLRFPVKDSENFLNLVKEHIFQMPQCMWYKLGPFWEENSIVITKARLAKAIRTKKYQSKEDIKIRRNVKAKEFYRVNKDRILREKIKSRKTDKYRNYMRNYNQKEEVKVKRRERERIYRRSPEYKKKFQLYQREYRKRPYVRKKIKEYNQKVREQLERGDKN